MTTTIPRGSRYGHPFVFDARLREVAAAAYHMLAPFQCGYCGAPSEVVRVVRLTTDGVTRFHRPMLAGQMCVPCATGEQRRLREAGFTYDPHTHIYETGETPQRTVDTTAVVKTIMPGRWRRTKDPEPLTTELSPMELRLLAALAKPPHQCATHGYNTAPSRLVRRGMAIVCRLGRGRTRGPKVVRLLPLGRQVAKLLPPSRKRDAT